VLRSVLMLLGAWDLFGHGSVLFEVNILYLGDHF
jgi:hypothetical protein